MTSPPPRSPGGNRTPRVPAGLGCLVALVALPLALLAAFVSVLRALVRPPPRRRHTVARSAAPGSAHETVLCEFVRKMSLDAEFDLAEARTAGLPVDGSVTVEGLIADGVARGWIERRASRYAVTSRGRAAAERHLQGAGL